MAAIAVSLLATVFVLVATGVSAASVTVHFSDSPTTPPIISEQSDAPAPGAPGHFVPDGTVTGWMPWPFVHWQISEVETAFAVHPFFQRRLHHATGERTTDVLWPFLRRKHDPLTYTRTDRRTLSVFPLYFGESALLDGRPYFHRFALPLYWEGKGTEGGRYFILAPFLWYAREAEVSNPFFPRRPQTFAAIWPLAGYFENFWNRDIIKFFAWPLYVYSAEGEGEDRVQLHSAPWPFLGWYRGETIKGFRIWPLVSWVHRPGEFTRGYYLWPLGHHRREYSADEEKERPREVDLFLPFYGRVRAEKVDYDLVFPLYGRLDMRGREVRGYGLAIYNEDDNLRRGIREHRLLWFLIRWTSRIPIDPQFAREPGEVTEPPMEGGGFFPFFVKRANDKKLRQTVLWPIYHRRVDVYEDYTFSRSYLMPFWGSQEKTFSDERRAKSEFLFPFYRYARTVEGREYRNFPHLFPYSRAESFDRNWAPVWSVWTEERDEETGAVKERVMGPVWQYDRNWLGVTRRELNLGIVSVEKWKGEHRPDEHRVELLWGLVDYHKLGSGRKLRIFGKRL